MRVELTKSPFNFKKFSIQIHKRNTKLNPKQIVRYMREFTNLKWVIRDEVHDKFYLETVEIKKREIRKKWKGRVIEIPEPKED